MQILSFLFLILILSDLNAEPCECDKLTRLSVFNLNQMELVICGSEDADDGFIYSPIVKECSQDSVLFDDKLQEIFPYKYEYSGDTLKLISYTLILEGDSWDYKFVPACQYNFFVIKNAIQIKDTTIFRFPELSTKQKKDIDSLIIFLEKSISEDVNYYPGDEKSLYMLSMAALNDYKNSKDLLSKIEDYFLFDGALKETLGEICTILRIG